jgi:hypothetical protein
MRGQAHTLEAVVAGLLLLSSIIFALQATAVTPLSASTSSQHIENQQRSVTNGILSAAAEEGALKSTVLYWNDSTVSPGFHNTSNLGYYTNGPPNTTFGRMLARAFDDRSISYNVRIVFRESGGELRRRPLVDQGVPSDNAVVSGRTVTITDDDPLYSADEEPIPGSNVSNASAFYMRDRGANTYQTVRVEVITWRI